MKQLNINPVFRDLIQSLTADEFKQLEDNVLAEGIRDAIVVWNDTIVDGHNRYQLAQKHSLQFDLHEVNFNSQDEAVLWIIDNQLGRRNLTDFVKLELQQKRADVLYERGKSIKSEVAINRGFAGNQHTKVDDLSIIDKTCRTEPAHNTQKEIAESLNWSTGKVAQGQYVIKHAPEEVKEKLRAGELSMNEAYKAIKTEEKKAIVQEQIQVLKEKEVQPSTGIYDVIVIDPPWQMEKIEREVAPNQVGFDYPTMTIDEIKAMDLPAEENCHVFMWITQKHHRHGFEIFDAWGVNFICEFVWHKNGGFQPFGLPQFNHEYVMYGRIGTPTFIDFKNFFTCFNANRTGHSAKPEEFYDTIRRVTAGKRIDMFNRRKIEGYDTWGNQAV
jgi:N6-adenosine-specific RNA methylase IME4